ncbi:MAG: helix-turn-helix domain-containing protein [Variibacter sp.]
MPREKKHSPVSIQRPRPPRKQGHVTVEDVEAIVRWCLETYRYTPWFDTEAAAAYLRKEPGTLKGWRSRGYGPRFHVVNGQTIRYHLDDLDSFIRGGKRGKRLPKRLKARIAEWDARQEADGR